MSDHFSHPAQPLNKVFREGKLSVTLSVDYLLDCIKDNSEGPVEGVVPISHVVLADTAQADTITQEVRSLAWMITRGLDSHDMVRDGRVFVLLTEERYTCEESCASEPSRRIANHGVLSMQESCLHQVWLSSL